MATEAEIVEAAGFWSLQIFARRTDGRNNLGERAASGIYFYHLTAGDTTATRKMVILK